MILFFILLLIHTFGGCEKEIFYEGEVQVEQHNFTHVYLGDMTQLSDDERYIIRVNLLYREKEKEGIFPPS